MSLATREKPARPYPNFPLFAHGNGMWCKKIGGQARYFGKWSDPTAALNKFLAQKDALYAGRKPLPVGPDDLTIFELANDFLGAKKAKLDAGEIEERTWTEYRATCRRLVRVFGAGTAVTHLASQDFERLRKELQSTWGPVRIGNEIQRVRCVFKHGVDAKLLDGPPNYGQSFQKPSRKTLRKNRQQRGRRMFEAHDLRRILDAAGPTLRAMILLAINCGFGNHDVATIEKRHVDLRGGWVEYPRPKTGIERRCPLWPETVKALRRMLKLRGKSRETKVAVSETKAAVTETMGQETTPKAAVPETTPIATIGAPAIVTRRRYRKLLFLTSYGRPWRARTGSPISEEFGRRLRRLGLHRPGLNFYALRHTFETIGSETERQVAVDFIMGHAAESSDMSAVYREHVKDERLRAVTDYVRAWLFGPETGKQEIKP